MQRHWSVDEERFKRTDPVRYRKWQIEQRVNVGIGAVRLKRTELIKHWPRLKLDPDRKRYLERILWPDRS